MVADPAIVAPDDGKLVLWKLSWFMLHALKILKKNWTFQKNWIKSTSCSYVSNDTVWFNSCTTNEKFYMAFECKVEFRKTKVDFDWFSNRQEWKSNNQSSNFDHVNVTNMYVMLNSRRSPEIDYEINLTQHKFSKAYDDTVTFRTIIISPWRTFFKPKHHTGRLQRFVSNFCVWCE